MSIAVVINHISDAGDICTVRGTFQVSGNYTAGAGNGEVIDWKAAVMALFAAGSPKGVPSSEAPIQASAWPRAGGAACGLTPIAGGNTVRARFFTAANTELTGAPTAYPAYMTSDTYDFVADFRKLI